MGTEKGGRGKEPFTLIGEYSPQKLRGGLERQISSYLLYLLADLEDVHQRLCEHYFHHPWFARTTDGWMDFLPSSTASDLSS